MTGAHDRLRLLRKRAGFNHASEFARAYDIVEATYRAHENGDRNMSREAAQRYSDIFRVPIGWLLFGEGDEPDFDAIREAVTETSATVHHVHIPEIDVRGGCGLGGDGGGRDSVRALWDLPEDYIRQDLRVSGAGLKVIEVRGDSMTPTLLTGDRVIIDTTDTSPSPPGLFALWDGLGVVVKRVDHVPGSDPLTIEIISDNHNHRSYQRTMDESRLIGRAVGVIRRL